MTAVVALELTSPVTQSAAEFSVGQAFKQGDVPSGQYLHCDLINFTIIPTCYWNDGSVKLATITGRVPLTANVARRVNIWRNSSAESVGIALTATDIATAAPTAAVQFGSFGTVSLSSLLASPVLTYYSTKEMVCCVYSAKCPGDVSLHAEFVVSLYASGTMEIEVAAYNGYLNGTESVQKDYVPTVTINGVIVWNNGGATYHHSRAASWVRRGWVGNNPQVTPSHDKGYLVRTRLFGNYNIPSPTSVITAHAPYTTYSPGDNLLYSDTMGGVGYQADIGLIPNWEAAYLTTATNATMYNVVMAHADAIRSYAIAWYDTNTARPIKITDFPRWSMAGFNQGGTPGANTIKQDNSTTLTWEKAHHPSVGYMAYILTGKYLHLQTCCLNALTMYLTNSYLEGEGLLRVPAGQPRARGWAYRTYGDAGSIVPSHVATQFSEIRTLVANVMSSRVAKYVTPTYAAKWTGLEDLLDNARIPSGYSYNGQMAAGASPFEQSFIVSSMCHAADAEPCDAAGMVNLRLFRDHVMQFIVGISGGGTANDYNSGYSSNNAVHVRTSSLFTYASSSQVPVTAMNPSDWGQIFSDSHGYKADGTTIVALGSDNGSGLAVTYNPPNPSTTVLAPSSQPDSWPSPTGSAANLRAALALAVDHNATGASASWARILSAPNYATTQGSADYAGNPVFALSPRSSGEPALLFTPIDSGATMAGIGATTRVDSGNWISGKTVVGQRGLGILAQNIPSTGTHGPALAYNDLSFPADNDKEVRVEIITQPASGTWFVYEDTSFTYTGPDNTTNTGTYKLWVAGVDMGNATVTLNTGVLDATTPVMVGSLASSAITTSGFTLSWSAATDNVGVTGYEVSIDNGTSYTNVGNVLTISETSLAAGTVYNCKVRAYDAANNKATPLSLAVSTSAAPDSTAPTMSGSLTVSAITSSGFTVSWLVASDNVAVTGYELSTDNGTSYINVGNVLSYACTGKAASTLYNVKVRALDAVPNRSAPLSTTATTSVAADVTGPALGGTVTITAITTGGFTASWSAATDAVGVTGYEISVDAGTPAYSSVGNVLTSTRTGLSSATLYNVRVRAFDAAGNRSSAITTTVTTATAGSYATTCTITFQDRSGNPRANLTGMKWAFFDQTTPDALGQPTAKGTLATTNSSGVAVLNISGTQLSPGATGWLIFSNSDGTATQSNLISFAGPVVTA